MSKQRILYIASEINPFLQITKAADFLLKLPHDMQEKGYEIRILVPRFGNINERKNRLHEVVRLSGISITIGDDDKPLIIKVASIPQSRLQVYFLDNEDYFQRKYVLEDKDGKFYEDNDERAIFFCKGAIETVKKLGWIPNIVHCVGWMSALVPAYLKTKYKDEPIFADLKTVFSIYNDAFDHKFGADVVNKAIMAGVTAEELDTLASSDYTGFVNTGIKYADYVVQSDPNLGEALNQRLNEIGDKKIDVFTDTQPYSEAFYEIYNK
jgi:starch synthase